MAELGNFFVTIGSKFDSKGMDKARQAIKGVAIAGAAMGAALVAAGLKAAAMAGIQERAELTLAQAMQQAGTYTKEAFEHNLEYASSLQKMTAYGDEAILGVQRMLTNFGIEGEALDGLTKATLDLAAAKGMDLKAAGDLVAKSVGSSTNALTRYGIVVEGAVGSTERSQMAIENISKIFGGAAKANAETYLGKIEQLKNRWGDFVEKIGENVIPIVKELIDQINDKVLPSMEEWIKKINETGDGINALGNAMKIVVKGGLGVIKFFDVWGTAIASVAAEIMDLRNKFGKAVNDMGEWLNKHTKGLVKYEKVQVGVTNVAKFGWEEVGKKLMEYNKKFNEITNFQIVKKKEKETSDREQDKITTETKMGEEELRTMDVILQEEVRYQYKVQKTEQEIKLAEKKKEEIEKIENDLVNIIVNNIKSISDMWGAFRDYVINEVLRVLAKELIKTIAIAKALKAALSAIGGGFGFVTGLLGFQKGVRNFVGGLAVVGEAGPELVHLPKGSDVLSHTETKEFFTGGNIIVNLQPIGTRQEAKRIGKIVGDEIFGRVKKTRRV